MKRPEWTIVYRSALITERFKSHPAVGVARFGSKVSDRLSSLREEPAVGMKKVLVRIYIRLGLAHIIAGRVARTIVFQVLYRVRY